MLGAVRHAAGYLRGDYGFMSPPDKRVADELLGQSAAIAVGGVYEIHARVQRGVNYGRGALGFHATAEVVGAQPDGGYLQGRICLVVCIARGSLLSFWFLVVSS